MSGALSAIAGGVSAVADLITGGAPVTLGSFTFQAFEVPARIKSGGAQARTLHKLPGGARVMDTTGPDDDPVTWSGLLLGANAKRRSEQLDQIRSAGQPLDLIWGTSRLRVVVATFVPDEGFNEIGYQISCDRVPLPPDPTATPKESLLDQIGDAVGVTGLTAQIGMAADALGSVQDSLQRISSVIPGVPGLAAVSSGLSLASGLAQSAANGAAGALGAVTTLATAANLSGAITASGVLAGGVAVASLASAGVRTIQAL